MKLNIIKVSHNALKWHAGSKYNKIKKYSDQNNFPKNTDKQVFRKVLWRVLFLFSVVTKIDVYSAAL